MTTFTWKIVKEYDCPLKKHLSRITANAFQKSHRSVLRANVF